MPSSSFSAWNSSILGTVHAGLGEFFCSVYYLCPFCSHLKKKGISGELHRRYFITRFTKITPKYPYTQQYLYLESQRLCTRKHFPNQYNSNTGTSTAGSKYAPFSLKARGWAKHLILVCHLFRHRVWKHCVRSPSNAATTQEATGLLKHMHD